MTEEFKLCKDCKWLSEDFLHRAELLHCLSPNRKSTHSLVSGKTYYKQEFASLMREYPSYCGESGKWWEPKPPSTWQKVKTYFS